MAEYEKLVVDPGIEILLEGHFIARRSYACQHCPQKRSIAPGSEFVMTVVLVEGELDYDIHCIGRTCAEAEMAAERERKVMLGLDPDDIPF